MTSLRTTSEVILGHPDREAGMDTAVTLQALQPLVGAKVKRPECSKPACPSAPWSLRRSHSVLPEVT